MREGKIKFQFSVSIHLYKSLAQLLITMIFIYLDDGMKIMIPMCLTKLLGSSKSVTVKMTTELKKYNDFPYTISVISFGADKILEHVKHSTVFVVLFPPFETGAHSVALLLGRPENPGLSNPLPQPSKVRIMGTIVCHHMWLSGASKSSVCLSPSWFSFSDSHSVGLEWKPRVCVAT